MLSLLPVRLAIPRFTARPARSGPARRILPVLATAFIAIVATTPSRATAHAADTLTVTLSAPEGGKVAEGETGHFGLSVSGSTAGGAVTVRYSVSGTAVAGVDYTALPGEVTVAQGDSVARIALSALEDGILDKGETVVLALTGATGPGTVVVDGTAATATIADHGTVSVSLTPVPDTIDEGSAWSSTVTMSTPVADRVSVRWRTRDGSARAGQDYVAANAVVSFRPGETSKPIRVKTLQDDSDEPVEVFYVYLDAPSISTRDVTAKSVRVNADARSAFISCSVSFPSTVTTTFTVVDTVSTGTAVGTVAANTTGFAVYTLSGGGGAFSINSSTGEISTATTLDADTKSSYSLTVSVLDVCGASASIDVTIRVKKPNAPPTVTAAANPTQAGTGQAVSLTATATDPNGDRMTYQWTQLVGGPRVSINGARSLNASFTAPEPGSERELRFQFTATDAFLASGSTTVTVRLNDPPICDPIPAQSLKPGQYVDVDLAGLCTDEDPGDRLSFSDPTTSDARVASVGLRGSVLRITGVARGTATVGGTATDLLGASDTASGPVTVNTPPTCSAIPEQMLEPGESVDVDLARLCNDEDPGDRLSFSDPTTSDARVASVGLRGSMLRITGVARGTATVGGTATDLLGASATASGPVTVNTPPTCRAIPEQMLEPGESVDVDLARLCNDEDPGDRLSFSDPTTSDARVASVGLSGSVLRITGVARGTATVGGTATDLLGASATASGPVTVNTPPTCRAIPEQMLEPGESVDVDLARLCNDEDPGDRLSFSDPTTSDARVASVGLSGSVLRITGVSRGTATVTGTATDLLGASATASGPVTVNTPPTCSAIPAQSLEPGGSVDVDLARLCNDEDPGDRLSFSDPTTSDARVASVGLRGSVLRITGVSRGTATVTGTATDLLGATATTSGRVTVMRRNRAPEPVGRIADAFLELGQNGSVDVSGYFRDPDGDPLTYRAGSSDADVVGVGMSGSRLTYSGDALGEPTVTVTARDPGGLSARQSFTVTVYEPCVEPTARAGRDRVVRELERVTLDGSGSTSGVSYSWEQVGTGPRVTLSGVSLASPSFDAPPVAADVVLTFRLTVTDDCGSDPDEVAVTIRNNVGPAPVGTIPAQSVARGDTGSVSVVGYFRDPEGDALTYSAASSDSRRVSVSVERGRVKYRGLLPGAATVTVTARDRYGDTGRQSFRVTVADPNRAPEVVSAIPALTVAAGTSEVVDVSGRFRDPDGDALTYEASSSNTGAATARVNGSQVTVAGVSRGTSQVTVTARDVHEASVSQRFEVTVPNRAPAAVGTLGAVTVHKGEEVAVEVAGAFSDPDSDALTYEASSSNGAVVAVSASGSQVTVSGVLQGEATVTVTADDDYGGRAEQEFRVEVPNRAPAAVGGLGPVKVYRGVSATVDAAAGFSDPDEDVLSYAVSSSDEGVATVSVSGSDVTVTGVSPGAATVTVTADDGYGGTAEQSMPVTVQNRGPLPAGRLSSRELVLGDTVTVEAWNVFEDADGDALKYSVSSTDAGVAAAVMRDSTAVVIAVGRGSSEVRVRATDPAGLWAEQRFTVRVRNREPLAVGEIGPRTVAVGERWTVALAAYFRDDDGDDLAYAASASDPAVASASVDGGELTVIGVAKGRVEVTVTADDGHDGTAEQSFLVTVPNRSPAAVGAVPARSVTTGAEGTVDMAPHFEDPDGDDLTYEAASSNEGAVRVKMSGSEVRFRGESRGSATVTVRAMDDGGLWAEQPFEVTVANAAPAFSADAAERAVAENARAGKAVGAPVVASDADGDAVTYRIAAGDGDGRFEVGLASGQLTVAPGAVLDYESGDTVHVVRVVASDGTLADTLAVTVRLTDVRVPGAPGRVWVDSHPRKLNVEWAAPRSNGGARITGYDLRWREEQAAGAWAERLAAGSGQGLEGLEHATLYQVQVRARNIEGGGEWSDTLEAWTARPPAFPADTVERAVVENAPPGTAVGAPVTATDPDNHQMGYEFPDVPKPTLFSVVTATGQIEVAEGAVLDHESEPEHLLRMTADDGGHRDTVVVRIRVTDVPAPDRPDRPVVAGGEREIAVTWTAPANEGPGITNYDLRYRAREDTAWTDVVALGTVLSHTFGGLEQGTTYLVQVRAESSEGAGEWSQPGEGTTDGVPANRAPAFGADTFEREVPENSALGTPVGDPVTATDPDGTSPSYALVAAGAPFEIDAETGQLTVAEGAVLDYESGDTLFMVTVEASDGELADTAAVTIRVTNADDPGRITLSAAVARVGVQLTATLMDQDVSIERSKVRRWQRSDDGASSWTNITSARTRFYTPVAADRGKYLRAVFTYADGLGPGKRAESPVVRVTGPNVAPAFGAAAVEREVAENSPPGTTVGEPVAATDGNEDDLAYRFVSGADERLFEIDGATGQIRVTSGAALDYESGDTLHAVSVEASDGELADTADVTIRVTNADDPGKVALSADVARVGEQLTATLMDQDGSRRPSVRRTWQRSGDGASAWTDIPGARTRFYTPVAADEHKYLRAVFTYADGHGAGKRAESAAVAVVGATTQVVSFGAVAYTAAVGETADVVVLLSPAAAVALAIPVTAGDSTHTVAFQPGDSAGTVVVGTGGLSATDTVEVRFGSLPAGVVAGVPAQTRIVVAAVAGDIAAGDGSLLSLAVEYAQTVYTATAGGPGTEITLRMTPPANRRVEVSLTAARDAGPAAVAREPVVPGPVVFEPGDSLVAFTLELPASSPPGRLTLAFGELPEAVSEGADASATVDIAAADDAGALLDEAFDVGLAVFGRAVAEGARQAIGGRIDAVMRSRAGPSDANARGSAAEWAGRAAGVLTSLTGVPLGASTPAGMARRSGPIELPTAGEAADRLLPRISFATALGPQTPQSRPRLGLWAQGSVQGFRGEPGDIGYDGGLRALTVGADARIGASALVGLSFMRSDGDLDYSHRSVDGTLSHAMNSIHPYLFIQPSPRIGLWAMAGYGGGDVDDDASSNGGTSAATLRMLSGGVKVPLARRGAFGLALTGDAFTAGMRADNRGREGSATRARALIEASWAARGLKLATQAGARYDGGDADAGAGAETGASLAYAGHGFDLALNGRLALGSAGHREWGAGLRLAFDPGTRGEGFRFALSPARGHHRSSIHGLLEGGRLQPISHATAHASQPAQEWRLDAEAGYALKTPRTDGALDSYTRLSAGAHARSWSLGSGYHLSRSIRLAVEGSRNHLPGQPPNLGLRLGLDFKF